MIARLAAVFVMSLLVGAAIACGEASPSSAPTGAPLEDLEFEADPFALAQCRVTRAAQLPIELEYEGTVPTGFDGVNTADCTFTHRVKAVGVILSGPLTGDGEIGNARHLEVYTFREPGTRLEFPLPEQALSRVSPEIVHPGQYHREMRVIAMDGRSLVISDQPSVLETVTVLGPTAPSSGTPESQTASFEVARCTTPRAGKQSFEYNYSGTLPTGFAGFAGSANADCTFSKPVKTVTVTLIGPVVKTEVRILSDPSTELRFPLAYRVSVATTETKVPEGEYRRELRVTSVDGETLVLGTEHGVVDTVTMKSNRTPGLMPIGAFRLNLRYRDYGKKVRLESVRYLVDRARPSDDITEQEPNVEFSYDLRDKAGRVVYRRVVGSPFVTHVIMSGAVPNSSDSISLKVPDIAGARTLVIRGRAQDPGAPVTEARELVRVDLNEYAEE